MKIFKAVLEVLVVVLPVVITEIGKRESATSATKEA